MPTAAMTTAHRATWRTARGGDNEAGSFRLHVGSAHESSKAAPGHRLLKEREGGEPTSDRAALRASLEAREAGEPDPLPVPPSTAAEASAAAEVADGPLPRKRARLLSAPGAAGQPPAAPADESSDDDSDSDDDDAELLAELERIRAERAAERERREAEERESLERAEEARVASANPLLAGMGDNDDTASVATSRASFAVKRRWNDDVVFKDKARGERRPEQRFVNDTIRNDFHKRFLRRYMR